MYSKAGNWIRSRFLLALALVVIPNLALQPSAQAIARFGSAYEAPMYVFGGGKDKGISKCGSGEVVVGITFLHNPMFNGFICKPIKDNLTIDPVSADIKKANPNHVFCPDGYGATGYIFSNPDGQKNVIYAGLTCKKPKDVFLAATNSQLVSGLTKVNSDDGFPIDFRSTCKDGDFMIGQHYWADYWIDQLAAVCGPYATGILKYNLNGGSGKVPAAQLQLDLFTPEIIVTESKPTLKGRIFVGWNTRANGKGKLLKPGASFVANGNVTLYAQWQKPVAAKPTPKPSATASPSPTFTPTSKASITPGSSL